MTTSHAVLIAAIIVGLPLWLIWWALATHMFLRPRSDADWEREELTRLQLRRLRDETLSDQ